MLNKLIEDFHSSGQILKIADSSYWFQLFKKQFKKKSLKSIIKYLIHNQITGYINGKLLLLLGVSPKFIWIILLFI